MGCGKMSRRGAVYRIELSRRSGEFRESTPGASCDGYVARTPGKSGKSRILGPLRGARELGWKYNHLLWRPAVLRFLGVCLFCLTWGVVPACAQFDAPKEGEGLKLGKSETTRYTCGARIRAGGGPVAGVTSTITVPDDWPEQQVKIASEDIGKTVRVSYRKLEGGLKQMVIQTGQIPVNTFVNALVTWEITRSAQLPPPDPSAYLLPKKLRSERKWLGPSPGMDPQSTKIKNLVKEVTEGKETAWEQIEAVYDAVRDRVKLDRVNPKHVNDALKEGKANKEMLTAVFVTACRAMKVPARTVWITDGCYAEFYLEDAQGTGFWFPAMVVGDKQFGKLEDFHPILQKGDNFKVPELNEPQKFVPEVLKGKPGLAGGGRPEVEFVRRVE
jgi:hypothetical protein